MNALEFPAQASLKKSVKSICQSAFNSTCYLRRVIFENGSALVHVGDSAFETTAAEYINIPAGVLPIDEPTTHYRSSPGTVYVPSESVALYQKDECCGALSIASLPSLTVKYLDYDGTILKEETVLFKTAITFPAFINREEYRFSHWSTSNNFITSDLEVTGIYLPE